MQKSHISLIVFDLDGVLIDGREIHFESLNMALFKIDPKFVISKSNHYKLFDGLSTRKKIDLLVDQFDFPSDMKNNVFNNKQKYTIELMQKQLKPNRELLQMFVDLKQKGFKIAIATNCIKETAFNIISLLGIDKYVDHVYTNEEVLHPKPSAEPYLLCMLASKVSPDETLILEDSPVGRFGACRSGAHLMPIDKLSQVSLNNILQKIKEIENSAKSIIWASDELNIVIPMAGDGSRFGRNDIPKPFLNIQKKPMIQWVIESLNIQAKYTFIIQKSHSEQYDYLKHILNLLTRNPHIIEIDAKTEGAACTVLLAKHVINNNNPLLIANCDQYIEWDSCNFMHTMNSNNVDGSILTFKSNETKWSYAKVENDQVTEVAEKKVISDKATVGIYWWRKGSDYVKCAEQMIAKNIRTNNEFYVCPVYNEAILNNMRISHYEVNKMMGLGTPEDVENFKIPN